MSRLRIMLHYSENVYPHRRRWVFGEEFIICDAEVHSEFPMQHQSALTNEEPTLWLEVIDVEPKEGDWREFRGQRDLYGPLEERLVAVFGLEGEWLDEDFEGNENGELFQLWWRVTTV